MKSLHARLGTLALLTLLSGCSASGGVFRADSGPPQQLRLVYETEADRLGLPAPAVQQASYQGAVARPLPAQTKSTIVIQYPHPKGYPDMALVRVQFAAGQIPPVEVRQANAWQQFTGKAKDEPLPEHYTFREVWVMDIPKSQAEAALADLKTAGFYNPLHRATDARSLIASEVDGKRVSKDFEHVPAIDQLISRVRTQGRLINAAPSGGAACECCKAQAPAGSPSFGSSAPAPGSASGAGSALATSGAGAPLAHPGFPPPAHMGQYADSLPATSASSPLGPPPPGMPVATPAYEPVARLPGVTGTY